MKMNKERYDSLYRQIDAMCHEGYGIRYIVNDLLQRNEDLSEFQIIDIIQTIDAKQKMRDEGLFVKPVKKRRAY